MRRLNARKLGMGLLRRSSGGLIGIGQRRSEAPSMYVGSRLDAIRYVLPG